MHSESTKIVETTQRPESARVLRHRLLVCWAVYRIRAHYGAHPVGVMLRTLKLAVVALVRVRVLLHSHFSRETYIVCCNCIAKIACCEPGPPVLDLFRLWQLVLLNKDLNFCSYS